MKTKKILLPILVLLIAVGITFVILKTRKKPQPVEVPHLGPLVETVRLEPVTRNVVVVGTGTVQSRHEVDITPQVKGRVVKMSPNLVAGGTFREGELLFAIEDVDYQLAIDLARASLAQTELDLQRNANLARVARQEWEALHPGGQTEPDPLVVYEPQMKSAQAQRDAAAANLKQAEINLQRTQVLAPFDGYVRSEQVEIGQYLTAGAPVAKIIGTAQTEIAVPLPLDELVWLDIPETGGTEFGSPAKIELRTGGEVFRWQGQVSRALGEIDPRNRMAHIMVLVTDPVSERGKNGHLLNRLLPGMFVKVLLHGEQLSQVFAIPRGALRDNDTVWLANEDNTLTMRNVEIIRHEPHEVLVRSGVNNGDRLILTNLSGAAEGMLLRPQSPGARQ
jgi:RND family efflux transporter MFP subunit